MRFDSRGMRLGFCPSARVGLLWLAVAGLLAYAATLAVAPIRAPDTWVHLTTGRLILEERAVPMVDRYSFTAAGSRYVAHEWLAAVLYALGEAAAGLPGVIALGKVLPALAVTAGVIAGVAAAGARWGSGLPLCVLALAVVQSRIIARPELIALALLLIVLCLLLRDRARRRAGRRTVALLWVVPVACVWVNVHGSFPISFGLLLIFAAAELADRLLARRDRLALLARVVGVSVAAVGAAGLATLEPAEFGRPAAALMIAVAALFAVDGMQPIFRDSPEVRSRGPLRLLATAAAVALVVLANPRGAEIYLFPFEFTVGSNLVTSTVTEWWPLLEFLAPRYWARFEPVQGSSPAVSFLIFAGTGLGALALGIWRGRLGRLEVALLLGFGLLVLRHVRWMTFFAVATTPVLALTLSECGPARAPSRARAALAAVFALLGLAVLVVGALVVAKAPMYPTLAPTLAIATLCALAALALALWARGARGDTAGIALAAVASLGLAILTAGHGVLGVPGAPRPSALALWASQPAGVTSPVAKTVDFLRIHEISGRLFTEYEWAPYAIHQLWPSVTVFIDGRSEVYEERITRHYDTIKADPRAARRLLQEYQVDLVAVRYSSYPDRSRKNRGVLEVVESDPRWVLLYADDGALLYARRDLDRRLPSFFERLNPRLLGPHRLRAPDPALEDEIVRALQRSPHSSFLGFGLASLMRARGEIGQARAVLEEAWAANPGHPAAPALAGELAAEQGEFEEARLWFKRAQQAAPGWLLPRYRLADLPSAEATVQP